MSKWQSPQCNGILESKGEKFLKFKCINRCELYKDKKCPWEANPDISKLTPENRNTQIYFFNRELVNYGEFKNFENLKLQLNTKVIDKQVYFTNTEDTWFQLLSYNRFLLFAIFANIKGDVTKQRALIFDKFDITEHWFPLMLQDCEFYQDYQLRNNKKQSFSEEQWTEICIKYPHLYHDILNNEKCSFNEKNMIAILANHPNLDNAAYETMKAKGISGELWVELLCNSINKEGSEKFWDDCPFEKLSGENWIQLLHNAGSKARKKVKKSYGLRFNDQDWSVLKKSKFVHLFDHPKFMYFEPFFKMAPRHASKEQFKSMVAGVFSFTLLFLFAGIVISGNSQFFSPGTLLFVLIYLLIWTVGSTISFSKMKGGVPKMLINSAIAGFLGGIILPHSALLIGGYLDWSKETAGSLDYLVCMGIPFLLYAIIFMVILWLCTLIHWSVIYLLSAITVLGYFGILSIPPQKSLCNLCDKLNLVGAKRHYYKKFLEYIEYDKKFNEHCKNFDSKGIENLFNDEVPNEDMGQFDVYIKKLIDIICDNTLKKETTNKFRQLFKERFLDNRDLKPMSSKPGEDLLKSIIFHENDTKKLAHCAEAYKKLYEVFSDKDLKSHLLKNASSDINQDNFKSKCAIFAQIKDDCSEDEKAEFIIAIKAFGKDSFILKNEVDIDCFKAHIECDDRNLKDFWEPMFKRNIIKSVNSDIIKQACKRVNSQKLTTEVEEKLSKKILDEFVDIKSDIEKNLNADNVWKFLSYSSKVETCKNEEEDNFNFYIGLFHLQQKKKWETINKYWKELTNNNIVKRTKELGLLSLLDECPNVEILKECYDQEENKKKKLKYLNDILAKSTDAQKGQYIIEKLPQVQEVADADKWLLNYLPHICKDDKSDTKTGLIAYFLNNFDDHRETLFTRKAEADWIKDQIVDSEDSLNNDTKTILKYLTIYYINKENWEDADLCLKKMNDSKEVIAEIEKKSNKGNIYLNLVLKNDLFKKFKKFNNELRDAIFSKSDEPEVFYYELLKKAVETGSQDAIKLDFLYNFRTFISNDNGIIPEDLKERYRNHEQKYNKVYGELTQMRDVFRDTQKLDEFLKEMKGQ